jgi:uncharacterized Zn finger protein
VRAAALEFLESGFVPYRVRANWCGLEGRPEVIIDAAWPLPVPEEIAELLESVETGAEGVTPVSHPGVLLEMAIAAERADEVLHRFDRMIGGAQHAASARSASDYAGRVAEAVASAYPERSLEIMIGLLKGYLASATYSSDEAASSIVKKLRPIYALLDRSREWVALLNSIRETCAKQGRLMELLADVD